MLHPLFQKLLSGYFDKHSPESSTHHTKPEADMTGLELARAADAYHDALLAKQEAEDDAWEAARDEAAASLSFDDLLEALDALSDAEKRQALHEAATDRPPILAQCYHRLLKCKTQEIVEQAKRDREEEVVDE